MILEACHEPVRRTGPAPNRMNGTKYVLFVALIIAASGCNRAVGPLMAPGKASVALSGGPNTSMIYVARTSDGVLAVDLGWWGHSRRLRNALRQIGAVPGDVRHVFMTHSHRDHIAAWPMVPQARFHVGAPERPLLHGDAEHGGWIARWADRLVPPALPDTAGLSVHAFSHDTTFVIGGDTLHAYMVPGHTAGSAVYLFRGILFLGDAVTYSRRDGFRPAKRGFTDDRREAAASLVELWRRLPEGAVRYACTAHAHCAAFSVEFTNQVSGR